MSLCGGRAGYDLRALTPECRRAMPAMRWATGDREQPGASAISSGIRVMPETSATMSWLLLSDQFHST